MSGPGKDYTIGKGRLMFEQFVTGTKKGNGEYYFGNTPELSAARESETLDHFDADEGMNVKDESITTSQTTTLSFVTDNISPENVALWFGGTLDKLTIVAATAIKERFTVTRARFIQLGASTLTPQGTRKVTNVTLQKVTPGALPADPPVLTPIASLEGNVDVDLERARLYVEGDAPDIADGDEIEVSYDQEAVQRQVVIAKGQEVRGALRFLSANPVGTKKDHYWPYVKITSNGDYALKGDEWQQLGFTVEVLKLDAKTETSYSDMLG